MSGESVVLDTNIVVEHFRMAGKHDLSLKNHNIHLPHIVVAELYAGALRSQRPDHHKKNIDTFLDSTTLLASDLGTAKRYANIWAELAAKGRTIPHNDIWIAALAMQHGMTLISKDAHFKNIDKLSLEAW